MKNRSNIIYTFSGNLVVAFVKWLILIIIVRSSNPQDVGYYTFAIAITAPFILFINMRLRLRFIVENLDFSVIKKLRSVLNIICIVVIFIVAYIFYSEYIYYILIIGFSKILDLNSEVYYAVLHKKEKYKTISQMMISKSILIILAFSFSLFITKNVIISLIIQVVIQGMFLYIIERRSLKHLEFSNFKYPWKVYLNVFLIGLPLGFVQLLNSYNILIPRYIIEHKLTLDLVGIFASISYLLTIVDLFMNAISQNIIIEIKNKVKTKSFEDLENFLRKKVSLISITLGLILIFMIHLFGTSVLVIVYGEQYEDYGYLLTILSISFIFNFQSWIYDTTIMAFEAYRLQLISSIITLLVSIVISYFLISNYGIAGASISIVIITLTQSLLKRIILINMLKKEKRRSI
ncbi:polysaccharide biosynthesis C-terminal domain-containing protein [Mammaliicoccus sciuri]|uniref:lipopolysaccharide biosynthesis protein n=1 Tax=Mammaliicoccus sciuri TaxID=1296 RepID=UPI0019523F87|nr:polysaccharide biosynthesis C-terminal domain-containing protein [Mammaliicoccus sciuri]MEB5677410.1 polysaccharide biosynthesis C-terminal domain-containing protein [Mammaliicoccus sciuri]